MKACRECGHRVAEPAAACPECGAPWPARAHWDGWGFEYRTRATLYGLPLLHVSFKYRPGGRPVPAVGIIAIGQFGAGVLSVTQFGIGLFSVSQFTLAGFALAQFAAAWSLIAQIGVYIHEGRGQLVISLAGLLDKL